MNMKRNVVVVQQFVKKKKQKKLFAVSRQDPLQRLFDSANRKERGISFVCVYNSKQQKVLKFIDKISILIFNSAANSHKFFVLTLIKFSHMLFVLSADEIGKC